MSRDWQYIIEDAVEVAVIEGAEAHHVENVLKANMAMFALQMSEGDEVKAQKALGLDAATFDEYIELLCMDD